MTNVGGLVHMANEWCKSCLLLHSSWSLASYHNRRVCCLDRDELGKERERNTRKNEPRALLISRPAPSSFLHPSGFTSIYPRCLLCIYIRYRTVFFDASAHPFGDIHWRKPPTHPHTHPPACPYLATTHRQWSSSSVASNISGLL